MIRPMTITRRTLALASLALLAAPSLALAQARPLSADDKALVDRAVAYLEAMPQAKARFTQTDARGGTTRGTVYLQRPGRARFEYDPPSGLLVVSDGLAVSVADTRLNTFDRYPLTNTPLSLFLAKSIRLDRGVQVTQVNRMADGFSLVARDTRNDTAGQITLTFSSNPLALVGGTVTDAQRRATQVQLSGLAPAAMDPALFVGRDPRSTRKR
jgi:outer membrane lipoprotein-sorting protein